MFMNQMAFQPVSINTVPFSFGDTGIKCDLTGDCIIAKNANFVDETIRLRRRTPSATPRLKRNAFPIKAKFTLKKVCDSQNNCKTETYSPKIGRTFT